MRRPQDDAPGRDTEGAKNITDIAELTPTRTDSDAPTFGVMLGREVSTTRRCEGLGCWCHTGAEIAWPLSHPDEMARMFRAIRQLEVAQGVMGL